MKNYLIAERYAQGLSSAIEDDGQLEAALEHVEGLAELFHDSHDFRSLLANPAIDIEKRVTVLRELLSKEELNPAVTRMTEVLLRRKRISIIGDVAEVFGKIVDRRLNRVTARVVSAAPMNDGQRDGIARLLERFTGRHVLMRCKEDPKILGGVVARVGDTILDGSVKKRLEQLKKALLAEETPGAAS